MLPAQTSPYWQSLHSCKTYQVTLHLHGAQLITGGDASSCNPYAVVYKGERLSKRKSKYLKSTVSPEFDQSFHFANVSVSDAEPITIEIKSRERMGHNHLLGSVLVPVADAMQRCADGGAEPFALCGERGVSGDVSLSFTFDPPVSSQVVASLTADADTVESDPAFLLVENGFASLLLDYDPDEDEEVTAAAAGHSALGDVPEEAAAM